MLAISQLISAPVCIFILKIHVKIKIYLRDEFTWFVGSFPLRYVLVTVGPVFTEEMWRLACCALQDAFSATLEPVKV